MQYQVETTVVFIGLQDSDYTFDVPLLVFRRNLKSELYTPVVGIKELVVESTVKVPTEFTDEKKYDGYLLYDANDNRKRFGVNYPYADCSFSQLGTVTAERLNSEVDESEDERLELYSRFTDGEYVLSGIFRELRKAEEQEGKIESDLKLIERLKTTYDLMCKQVRKLGYTVTEIIGDKHVLFSRVTITKDQNV